MHIDAQIFYAVFASSKLINSPRESKFRGIKDKKNAYFSARTRKNASDLMRQNAATTAQES